MNQIYIILSISIGGAFGACSRHYLNELITLYIGKYFPFGILTVNVLGSFLIGLAVAATEQKALPEAWQFVITVGFLGSLTTFSTFSADNFLLMQQGEWIKVGLNILLNVSLAFIAVALGYHGFNRSA